MAEAEIMEVLYGLVSFFVIVLIGSLLLSLLFYILRSIGLYRLAVNRGMGAAWLAWIPVLWVYTQGAIADDINRERGGKSSHRVWMLALGLAGKLLGYSMLYLFFRELQTAFWEAIDIAMENPAYLDYYQPDFSTTGFATGLQAMSSISWLLGTGLLVFTLITLHRIFSHYNPRSATAWTVLCFFFGFLRSIFPFVIRNNAPQPAMPQPSGYYPPAGYPNQNYPQGYYQPPAPGQQAPPPPVRQEGGYQPPQGMYGAPTGYGQQPPVYRPPSQQPPQSNDQVQENEEDR